MLLTSNIFIFASRAEASAYRCFNRQSGQQLTVSNINIPTTRVSCLPIDSDTTPPSRETGGDPESVPPSKDFTADSNDDVDNSDARPSYQYPSVTTVDLLATGRAINLTLALASLPALQATLASPVLIHKALKSRFPVVLQAGNKMMRSQALSPLW